ncbi:hypothetical protein [Streptomyces sp. NPDC101776]|uniref:hypothetical protein n=1 Tax=Streptomyces sp. NPDC101776 TaxID=3366146 RepID=UPI00382BF706
MAVVGGLVGSGKTELVLTAAHQALAQGRFPGGGLFADVARLHLVESGTEPDSWRLRALVRLYVRGRPDTS